MRVSPTGDTTPPTAPTGLTATGGARQGDAHLDGVDRRRRRRQVQRLPLDDLGLHAGRREPDRAADDGTSYTDIGLAAGTYYYKVTADDTAGNTSAASNEASAVVPAAPPPGLVAAYGFDEGSGTTDRRPVRQRQQRHARERDVGGRGPGKFGNALSFNGTNAPVTVADSNSLDLTTGMTLEGWVKPNARTRPPHADRRRSSRATSSTASTRTPTRNRPESQVTVGCAELLDGTAHAPGRRLDAPRRHLRRHHASASTSTARRSSQPRDHRLDPDLDRRR